MTGYFTTFPLIYMTLPDGNNVTIQDFFRRVDVASMFGNVSVALMPYQIQPDEQPEIVSNKFYGSPLYHWVVILVNNIVDLYEEWPLTQAALTAKIADLYDTPNGIHHYVDVSNGYTIDFNPSNPNCFPVTNIEYENTLNDNKRLIRVLDPQYLSQFVQQFNTLIGE